MVDGAGIVWEFGVEDESWIDHGLAAIATMTILIPLLDLPVPLSLRVTQAVPR
jgi:hypothetical protein